MCPLKVVANLMPTGVSSLGCGGAGVRVSGENSSIVKQHVRETAQARLPRQGGSSVTVLGSQLSSRAAAQLPVNSPP